MNAAAEQDTLAATWMDQGLAWMASGDTSALESALNCFDRAIELREPLLASEDPWFRYNLAGAWLNKADALLRLGAEGGFESAEAAYDRTLAILDRLPAAGHPLFRRRIALAWLNRAIAGLRMESADPRDAVRALDRAIETAAEGGSENALDLIHASAWAVRSEALARIGSWDEAHVSALQAMERMSGRETHDAEAALIGLKARLMLGIFAARYFGSESREAEKEAQISEAIDAAEEGLRLAERWVADPRFAHLIEELFRLGADAYAWRQPQFLGEFIRDNLPVAQAAMPPDGARRIAGRAVEVALGRVAKDAFVSLPKPGIERKLALFAELRQEAHQLR